MMSPQSPRRSLSSFPSGLLLLLVPMGLALCPTNARAEVIQVTTSDDFAEIERAQPGDEVVIAPGTYRFRVFLNQSGTAAAPIVIRAQDPSNPPVWDLSGMLAENFPGSSTRGDRGRGCWQVAGSYYEISGLVFRGCTTSSGNAAGLRAVGSDHLTLRDILFDDNQVGLSGDGEDTLAEFCEFRGNGVRSSPPQHSTYIFGGSFTLRYSYIHDSVGGQNLHIRARQSVIEYNWIARAANYEIDMMPGRGITNHEMMFRGNVLISHASPINSSKLITLFNDRGDSGIHMTLHLLWNTIIVQGGGNPRLVSIRNDTLASANVEIANNVVIGTTSLVEIRDQGASNWGLTGGNNYLPTGTDGMGTRNNVFGNAPLFANAGALDFRPASGSPLLGAADTSFSGSPISEYAENESTIARFRPRLSALEIGAFAGVASGGSFGPYDDSTAVAPDAGPNNRDAGIAAGQDGGIATGADGGITVGGDGGSIAGDGSVAPLRDGGMDTALDGGCSCRLANRPGPGATPWLLLSLALLLTRRRRLPKSGTGE